MNEEIPEQQENTGRNPDGTFKEGVSGNPNGRPKFSLITILKEELQKIPEGKQHNHAYMLIQRILKSAIAEGNDAQIRNILQYIEGMPKQPIEHSGKLTVFDLLRDSENEPKTDVAEEDQD